MHVYMYMHISSNHMQEFFHVKIMTFHYLMYLIGLHHELPAASTETDE